MRIGYGTSVTVPSQQERWISELAAARCFALGTFLAASAGNFGEIQLFNPVASGKTIDIYRGIACNQATNAIRYRLHNTALATLVGTGVNLLSGGAAGVGELRTNSPAALDGTQILIANVINFDPYGQAQVWLARITAGLGFLVTTNVVNDGLTANFYWNEF
jgi:hypothetical protein